MKRIRATSNRGMTLVEVVISGTIITIIMMGVFSVFVQTSELSTRVNNRYLAMEMARSRLDQARTLIETSGFPSLTTLAETDLELDTDSDGDSDYKRTTSVTENYGGEARLTKIDVTVVYHVKGVWKDADALTVKQLFVNAD